MISFLKQRIKNEFFLPPDPFDQSHGVETRLSVYRKRLSLKSDSSGYQAIPAEVFERIAAFLPKERTFIDVGCGKGRTLIMAHELGFSRVMGVELSHDLLRDARKNLDKLHLSAELVQEDAGAFDFPQEPLSIFLYNPFGPATLQRFIEKLRGHSFVLAYVGPHRECFSVLPLIHANETFAVYR